MTPTQTTPEGNTAKPIQLTHTWIHRWEPLVVFFLFLLAVVVIGEILFHRYKEQLTRDAQDALGSISKLKTAQIASWMAERKSDAQSFQRDPLFLDGLERWSRQGYPHGVSRPMLAERLALLQKSQAPFGCTAIALFDEHGRLRLSTSKEITSEPDQDLLLKSMRTGQLLFSDIHKEKHGNEEEIEIDFPRRCIPPAAASDASSALSYSSLTPSAPCFRLSSNGHLPAQARRVCWCVAKAMRSFT